MTEQKQGEQYVAVAIPSPLNQLFTYRSPGSIEKGVRVKVPFGPRHVVGVVCDASDQPPETSFKIKNISEIIDENPVYSSNLLKLAQWMSQYYLHPIGEVLRTMLPAGSKSSKKLSYVLTQEGEDFVKSHDEHSEIFRHCFGKRKKLTQVTLRKKLKAWHEDVSDLERWFVNKGFLKLEKQSSMSARKATHETVDIQPVFESDTQIKLTEEQAEAIQRMAEAMEVSDLRPHLLRGVTGSGKTEVYLRMISQVLNADLSKQVLMMVPEISLTPQMTDVFTERFPGQVAVVHSGLNEADRWERLESIRKGQMRVLIGPRSAIFAPFQQLGLIIVDEEHDQSYKQATGLHYNGRDVAIVRAKLEGSTVILGSATPSLESYQNAKTGKYILSEMNIRARGNPLPEVELLQSEFTKGGAVISRESELGSVEEIPIHDDIIESLRKNHENGKQSIVVVNRRGYAYYLFELNDKKPVVCPDCSVSLTVHGRNQYLKCHYCEYKTSVAKLLESNPDKSYVVMGYGSQKAEDYLKTKIPEARIERLDSDTVQQKNSLTETLSQFRKHEIDILVGTQILAKGHDFPKVTLMAIVEVDKQLSLPDFRSGERSFQLLVQAAGRAGRAADPGKVLVQTAKKAQDVIKLAMQQDYLAFAEQELTFREAHEFPPFTRLVSVEYSMDNFEKLMSFDRKVEAWLDLYEKDAPTIRKGVKINGPLFPPIQTIRGRHRRQILFRDKDWQNLRTAVSHFLTAFEKTPHDLRMKVDVDPQTML